MKFVVDAQLPPALCRFLSDAGHTAEHVGALGLIRASDAEVWAYARHHEAVIVTKDEDFSYRSRYEIPHPPVIWVRFGNCSNAALLLRLEPLLPTILELIEAGEGLIEVR